ncbi:MAG TPA: phospholipase A [Smithellaceae bacterium]|nr:phospholipase A [Smithellaceae bacterium]HRS90014.1 phospholipase A [Smithellaceae bacterium]HRV26025.1 phospholipase A [Smithellaceae bacterium]
MNFRYHLFGLFFLVTIFCPLPTIAAGNNNFADCAVIKDNVERLKCYDNLARQKTETEKNVITDSNVPAKEKPPQEKKEASVFSRHWELDGEKSKHAFFMLTPYRPNYFLPIAYNSTPNDNNALDFDPDAKAQRSEAKFQLSFKVKPWCMDIDGWDFLKGVDLWIAYTQLSYWQLYNATFSSPFRDTNYEPEALVNFRTDVNIPGIDDLKLRFVTIGLNHQSNGRSSPLSRSWNRVVANAGFEKGNFNIFLKTWYRIPDGESKNDNPGITKYMGYGELWLTYYWKKNRISAMLRNNLRSENKGAVQLDWSIPLSLFWDKLDIFSIYFQYFNGYGESLIDYNASVNRISAGFMLVDWE